MRNLCRLSFFGNDLTYENNLEKQWVRGLKYINLSENNNATQFLLSNKRAHKIRIIRSGALYLVWPECGRLYGQGVTMHTYIVNFTN